MELHLEIGGMGATTKKPKNWDTLQGTNISYPTLGKGKSSSKMPFWGGYVSSLQGINSQLWFKYLAIYGSFIWVPLLVGHFSESECR